MSEKYKALLVDGCQALGVELREHQAQQLLAYLALFEKWNQAYNLSAVRDKEEMVYRHLLDSLSVVPHLSESENPPRRMIDVGTGGGLPGIPLAIAMPEKYFTLLDSNGKKTRFLFQVKTELGLDNVEVVQSRVQAYEPGEAFEGVISRAFASLADFVNQCAHLVTQGGRFYAMKGHYPHGELSELPKPYKVSGGYPLQVPGVGGQRHLLIITAAGSPDQ